MYSPPPCFRLILTFCSGVIASPPEVPVRNVLPLTTVVSIMDAVSTGTPFVVPPAPGIEWPVMQAQYFSTCRLSKSREFLSLFRLSASSPAPTLPRDSAKDSSPYLSLDRFSLYEGTHRLRLERPCCSRLQMTVWLQVWVIQTLLRGVNSIRGQNPRGLCLDVRLSGLYCRPDPPVLPTGSALRISTTLPEGLSTVTRMMEFVGDWCCARHSTLVDRTLEVDRRIAIHLPLLSDLS